MGKADWFKPRNYKHFDVPVGPAWAASLTPSNVVSHAWSPLLHWIKATPRYKPTEGKTVMKERDIMHASHRDACILSKYSAVLTEKLDAFYCANGLNEAVVAYRSLGKSNYHFASTAQEFVRQHQVVEAMCFDVTGFFDNIEHKRLKKRLKAILGVSELDQDWHRVFRAVSRYSFVKKEDLQGHPVFGIRMKQQSASRPIATVREMNAAGIPIHINRSGVGVPQGTPISASLSNLYLADFDKLVKGLADKFGALYQRYSDDILIICMPEHANELANAVAVGLGAEALQLQHAKTVRQRFSDNERTDFQYLGYQLGIEEALIRPGSLSRQWRTLKKSMRRSKLTAAKLAATGKKEAIFTRKLRNRFTHVGVRNFLDYANRSSDNLESNAIRQQVKKLRKFATKQLAQVKAIKNS
jgi:RNA-directed DNA polymerase